MVYRDERVVGRTCAEAQGKPTVGHVKAIRVLRNTVFEPEGIRAETFIHKDASFVDGEVSSISAPVTGPKSVFQKSEAESLLGLR